MCFPKIGHLIACAYDKVCIDLTRYSFSKTFFSIAHLPISKSKWLYYMYWVNFKITTLCSSLLETKMSYTTYIIGVGSSFNNKSWDLAEPFCGKDARVREIEQHWKIIKCTKVIGVPPTLIDLADDKSFDSF